AQPLLVLLPLNVELLLPAPELRRSLPVKRVPVDRQGVVDGDRVTHELSLGGERQLPVFEFRVLDLLVLLVWPVHRPDEPVPVLVDRQGGRPLLPADLIRALPRPDRVCLLALRVRQTADPEYQRR